MSVVRDRGAFLGVGVVTVRDEALGRLYDRAIAGLRTREDHRNGVCTASIAIRFAVYALEGVQALSEHAPYTFSATVAVLRALAAFGGVVWTPEHPDAAREAFWLAYEAMVPMARERIEAWRRDEDPGFPGSE